MQQPSPHLRFRFSGFCYSQSNGVRKYYMENSRQKQLISFKLLAVPSRVTKAHSPLCPPRARSARCPRPHAGHLVAMSVVSQGCVKPPDSTSRGPTAQEQRRCTSDPPGEPKARPSRPSREKEGSTGSSSALWGLGRIPSGRGLLSVSRCHCAPGGPLSPPLRPEAREASMKGFESGPFPQRRAGLSARGPPGTWRSSQGA